MTYNLEIHYTSSIKETSINSTSAVVLSGPLPSANNPMKHVIAAFRDSRLKLKIMIGGGQIDEQVCQYTDADAYRHEAVAAASLNRE